MPFLDGLPCPASPQLYAGAMITLRAAHSDGRPRMMPISAWWTVHPFSALLASPVSFPSVAPESVGFQNAAIREAFTTLLDIRIARGFALFEGRVAIFGPSGALVFASGQDTPTAERLAHDLSVYLLRSFEISFTRLFLANCALFVYRPASLGSEFSVCLHNLGGGYVLRVVPTADLRTIQEPIFLFPRIDSPVAHVSDAEASDGAVIDDHAAATSEVAPGGAGPSQAASSSSGPAGTSLAQTSFARRQPRRPSPRCQLLAGPPACHGNPDAGPQDAYASFAFGDPTRSASGSDDSRRSSAMSYLCMQEVPQFPTADV